MDAPLRTISKSSQMAVVLDGARDSQRVGYKLSSYLYMHGRRFLRGSREKESLDETFAQRYGKNFLP